VIWEKLQSHGIVLTPHLTGPLDEQHNPDELLILRSGTYNLGFIGLSRCPHVREFLAWWAAKLTKYCVVDHDRGFFVDQRWVDLVPGRFPDVYIHQDPGCNVAYWNLYHREVTRAEREDKDVWMVNGQPLKFFHFSGFSPDRPDVLSKYQNRYTFDDLPQLRPLFDAYAACLLGHGYDDVKAWPNVYSNLSADGVVIPSAARHLWRKFETSDPDWAPLEDAPDEAFLTALLMWLDEPVDDKKPLITRLALAVHQQQSGLRERFPDVLGRDRVAYARWYVTSVEKTFQFDPHFVGAMAASLEKNVGVQTRLYQAFTRWLFGIGLGQRIEQALGERVVGRIRDLFVPHSPNRPITPQATPEAAQVASPEASPRKLGVNVIGYLADETGVGENARATMRSLHAQEFPLAWTMVSSSHARQNDRSVLHLPEGHPYDVNLFCVNADQMANVYHELGADFFAGKYNIGYWFWELERFREAWRDRFRYLDEIWVGSRFVQNALAHVAPIPVVIMGSGVDCQPDAGHSRAPVNLADDKFTFLFAFDMLSIVQRKNPYGVIEAYRRAFGPDFADTQLVIKVTKLDQYPAHAARLRQAVAEVDGLLIDRYLDRTELDGLFDACDAYVSLHRSEGFGLTLAEAMCRGKPVIATDYGGNTDFMTIANSYPVAYRLATLEEDYPPYQKGQVWADPDLDHAAAQMRHVFAHGDEARQKGQRAAEDIRAWYGREAMAQKMIERLRVIVSLDTGRNNYGRY
jgi:glycosyltransferase involved in cell wall biosynthesis